METPDVLILGAGVVGCALARELARANVTVTVVDRGPVGGGASSAAAGLLVSAFGAAPVGALADLCRDSAARYEAWVEELQAEGAGEIGYRRCGLLEVWTDAGTLAEDMRRVAEQVRFGRRTDVLTRDGLLAREPALAPHVLGAAFYPDDAQVDPARLTRAVARAAERAGVVFREHEPVGQLQCGPDRILEVPTASARYQPGTVVLAAGAWSGGLAELLGLRLPMRPVRGQLVLADGPPPVRTPLHAGETLLVPQVDGALVLGGTLEDVGLDDRTTLDGVRGILDGACILVPAVRQLPLVRTWAGLRPGTPDGWPYMGRMPTFQNLWVSTGHFRKGVLLAPVCARLMAQSILADRLVDELEPFKPTRRIET